MEITGKIIAALEPRQGTAKSTGNPWMTQDFVIETQEQYPRRMAFNVFGEDKLKQFNIQVGQFYTVNFDINAREYNGRWYNDIRAWRVDAYDPSQAMGQQQVPPAAAYPQGGFSQAGMGVGQQPQQQAGGFAQAADSTDDLPF